MSRPQSTATPRLTPAQSQPRGEQKLLSQFSGVIIREQEIPLLSAAELVLPAPSDAESPPGAGRSEGGGRSAGGGGGECWDDAEQAIGWLLDSLPRVQAAWEMRATSD